MPSISLEELNELPDPKTIECWLLIRGLFKGGAGSQLDRYDLERLVLSGQYSKADIKRSLEYALGKEFITDNPLTLTEKGIKGT